MKYTDNVRFSHKLNWVVFIAALIYFKAMALDLTASLINSTILTSIYAFASAFIQPDLDHTTQRPGKDSFPLGRLKSNKIGGLIFPALYPLNRLWYYLWQPYGFLWTHRGLSHWPIIGTWTRAGYVFIILFILKNITNLPQLDSALDFLKLFFPLESTKISILRSPQFWIVYAFPFFLSDFVHFLVDLFDSIKNNTRFSSYAHEPGIIKQALNPKIIKYHRRALKKAKSNSRKRK